MAKITEGGGADDNVLALQKGKGGSGGGNNQPPDIRTSAENAVAKARRESYEAKVKAEVLILQEHKRAVILSEEKIDRLIKEFESGL